MLQTPLTQPAAGQKHAATPLVPIGIPALATVMKVMMKRVRSCMLSSVSQRRSVTKRVAVSMRVAWSMVCRRIR